MLTTGAVIPSLQLIRKRVIKHDFSRWHCGDLLPHYDGGPHRLALVDGGDVAVKCDGLANDS